MGAKAGRAWRWGLAGAMLLGLASAGCGDDPDGAEGHGGTALLLVNNRSAIDAELFIDSQPLGTLAAGGSQTYDGDYVGLHELLARSTDGTMSWGPVTVEVDKGGSHTWNLLATGP